MRRRIRVAVAFVGLWALLLDAALLLALLVKGIPRQIVWSAGHFVDGPVRWTPQDTAILTVLLLLQPPIFVFYKIARENRARAKRERPEE